MNTLAQLVDRHGVDVLDHLDVEVSIPVVAGVQCQGDLIVIPAAQAGRSYPAADKPVPTAGVELLRGQHPHVLVADPGTCKVRILSGQDLAVVEATEVVYLAHPEHGYAGLAPGRYVVRRQREQADEQRLVAD